MIFKKFLFISYFYNFSFFHRSPTESFLEAKHKSFTIEIVSWNSNDQQATSFELLFIYDDILFNMLENMTSAEYFSRRENIKLENKDLLGVITKDILPNKRYPVETVRFHTDNLRGIICFSNYSSPGDHRYVIHPDSQHLRFMFNRYDFIHTPDLYRNYIKKYSKSTVKFNSTVPEKIKVMILPYEPHQSGPGSNHSSTTPGINIQPLMAKVPINRKKMIPEKKSPEKENIEDINVKNITAPQTSNTSIIQGKIGSNTEIIKKNVPLKNLVATYGETPMNINLPEIVIIKTIQGDNVYYYRDGYGSERNTQTSSSSEKEISRNENRDPKKNNDISTNKNDKIDENNKKNKSPEVNNASNNGSQSDQNRSNNGNITTGVSPKQNNTNTAIPGEYSTMGNTALPSLSNSNGAGTLNNAGGSINGSSNDGSIGPSNENSSNGDTYSDSISTNPAGNSNSYGSSSSFDSGEGLNTSVSNIVETAGNVSALTNLLDQLESAASEATTEAKDLI